MFPGTRVVAVDDQGEELARIVRSLRELGIGCVSYKYPGDIPNEFSFSNVRVIFLDINLIGGAPPGNESAILSAPVSILERIISSENGPYALISWSDTELHTKLMDRIAKTPALADRQPFYSSSLSKAQYAGDPEALRSEIAKIFTDVPAFGALLDWERRIGAASNHVLKQVCEHAGTFKEKTPSEGMDRMLSCLAHATYSAHADKHRFEAASEALLHLLGDAINTEFAKDEEAGIWEDAVTKSGERPKLDAGAKAALNSAVSVEIRDGFPAYRRGAILQLPEAWVKPKAFAYRFGSAPDLITSKLLKADKNVSSWILVQAQAACDFNQPKGTPIPYLLGGIVDAGEMKGHRELPAAVWVSPEFAPTPDISTNRYQIFVLHGSPHYLTVAALKQLKFNVIGRFKDQITDFISQTHHIHGARPGTLSF